MMKKVARTKAVTNFRCQITGRHTRKRKRLRQSWLN
jgi:hypothetical protein